MFFHFESGNFFQVIFDNTPAYSGGSKMHR